MPADAPSPHADASWVRLADLARALDQPVKRIREWAKRNCPDGYEVRASPHGGAEGWCAPACVTALRQRYASAVTDASPYVTAPAGDGWRELVAELRAERDRARAVVAVRLDRLFRDASDALAVTSVWDASGVALHLLDLGGQSLDTSSAMGRFFLTVMAGAAELERSMLRERVRSALAHRSASGVYHANHCPFGYRREAAAPHSLYRPDPATAHLVREGYDRVLAGHSLTALAAWLNETGARPAGGELWTQSLVARMLARPVYIGMIGTSGLWPEPLREAVNVSPLVAPSVWQGVREILVAQRRRIHPGARAGQGVLGSLLVCAECGQRLWRRGSPRADGSCSYHCHGARFAGCQQPPAREEDLLPVVLPLLIDRLDPRHVRRRKRDETAEEQARARRLAELQASIDRLLTAYSHPASVMSPDDLHRQLATLTQERDTLANRPMVALDTLLPVLRSRRAVERTVYAMDRPELRRLLQVTIGSILVRDGEAVEVRWSA